MVDGYDSMEPGENAEGHPDSNSQTNDHSFCEDDLERAKDSNSQQTPTTTISTIALQSGDTRLVIALLQSGEWLRLKVLEVYPELTRLGTTVDEAKRLSAAHDEVLVRLQSKQSPVEELLRQADQLISTQRPRAEVYAAMADTLGQAWRDVNSLLELQKQILDHNVLFKCRAEEFKVNAKALEKACTDTLLPIEIEVVKKFLTRIHDLRKAMLSSLMGALQEGRTLLDCLREIANEGTLDSRPDRIKADANNAVLQVEKWLEELHDQRTRIELSFTNRKTQLEQCLALALLATDLRDLEEIINDRMAALRASSDQLGDSSSSAGLLLFELKKLQLDAKELQERSLKITKSTERLVSAKHFAGEQATAQAYVILETATEYVNELDQYEGLLNRAIAFFESARSAFTKLDQLEIQLATTEHPPHSPQLARFHAQTSATLTEVTSSPLAEGYSLLDVTGRGAPGAEGVKRTVEELENRKIRLLERCTAHKEENVRITKGLAIFFEKYEELRSWLNGIADAFLRGHQDMGSDLPMAKDFYKMHCQLLEDLGKRGDEIDEALSVLSGTIMEITDERQRVAQKKHVEDRVDALRDSWLDCRHTVEARLHLSALYVDFHEAAAALGKELDEVENEFKKNSDNVEEGKIDNLEKRWNELRPLYMRLTSCGSVFLTEADRCTDAYLDILRARLCVETTLERFANRQLTVTESWENWQTSVVTTRERKIEQERRFEETTKTLAWASKFGEQLYPIITSESIKPSVILQDLESTQLGILPELKRAVTELDARIKSVESFTNGDDNVSERIKEKLSKVYEHLRTTATDYQNLLESLISIFDDLVQIENKTEEVNEIRHDLEKSTSGFLTESGRNDIRIKAETINKIRDSITEVLKNVEPAIDQVISRIKTQEPAEAAVQETEKLNNVFNLISASWETVCTDTKLKFDKRLLFCNFADDLDRIDADLMHLSEQLAGSAESGHRFTGDSLPAAEAASSAFSQFEKTVTILEERIKAFIKSTENNVELTTPESAPVINRELFKLQERWDQLKRLSEATRERINSSIEYFRLLEEAKNWYRDGNKLMIVIARKSSSAKTPEEVLECLTAIDGYLKPGEELQEKRIEKIRDLSTRIFGTDRLPQFNEVVVENRETLDSFAVITSELRTLAQNLKNSADIFEEKQREKKREEEELRKLNVARAEAQAAYEAEIERKKLETIMEDKKKQEHALKSSVSAQTEEELKVVEETVTSAVTTKEIIILQKTEVEEDLPVLMPPIPSVYNQVKESTTNIKKTQVEELVLPDPPRFIVPLNDSTIEEGNRFIFECKLEHGKPKPEIIWYKDGISILNNPDYLTSYNEETGQCILNIEETFAEDSARFICKAFNTAGVAETGATLTIKETAPEQQLSPPTFVKELLPSVATKGSPHFLSCTVTGNPLPTVQWFKDNTNIEDSSPDYAITYNNGEAVLKFTEVLPDDRGVYTCKAKNKLGQASTSANLQVQAAEIDEKKTVEVIQSNGISSLTPEPSEESKEIISKVSFIKEHKIIQESRIIKIESHTEEMGGSASHIIPDASAQEITTSVNQEEIVVPVKVETGVVKSPEMPELFKVPELIKPSVQLPLKDVQVFEGNTVRLDCVIIGQPEPEVIWYHDDQPVKESADFQLLFQGDRCSLIIHEAFLDDAGKYKVVAINSQGEISSHCVLSVIPSSEAAKKSTVGTAPQFVKLIADVLVSEGEDAIFECQVTGEPKPDLRWYFNNEEIVFVHERITMTHDETGNCTLKISSTTAEDKGNYVAKAINLIGEAKAIARLVVKPASNESFKREELIPMEEKFVAPSFEEVFEDKRVVLPGVSTKFECIVHGKPTPKIQWMFNEKPVHGKSFLVSVSGDRQVLTIPETSQEHVGFISCVAENTAGKATCTTQLDVKGAEETQFTTAKGVEDVKDNLLPLGDEMQATSSTEKHFITERSTLPSDQVDESSLTKMSSSFSQSSTTKSCCTKEFKSSTTSSSVITEPQFKPAPGNVVTKSHVESREYSSQQNGGPPVVQSHKVEEYEQIVQDTPGQLRQEKTKIVTEGNVSLKMQKPMRKNVAPRFVSPLTGMIVDQGHDVVLEGVIDGFPTPTITWMKNGQDIKEGIRITFEHNHVRLELKNVNVRDAGRYTCTAVNDIGNASSTADLVVKKTIFPPVFGKRLQAQVVKKGDRVLMEVEITGTPEPTVTWYKDDEPLIDVDGQLKQIGNCYLLIIDAAEKRHAGKYMVHAVNAGGEGQSIADFAVFEPTPDTMVEVHKTIVYENVADKNLKLEEKKSELPSAALTAEHIATTTIQPSSTLKTLNPSSGSTPSSKIRKIELIGQKNGQHTEEVIEKATRSEMISSTIESHQSETKSEQKFHMKLQHQAPDLFGTDTPAAPTVTTTTTKISTKETQKGGEPVSTRTTEFMESKTTEKDLAEENENVETTTIAKKDALSFFESMSKDSELTPKGPKAMIKLTEEDKDGNYDVKVDKLTKNYERSTKFEEVKKPVPEAPAKKSVQDISHKFETPVITKGVDNVMIDFPYDDYKLPALNIQRTVLEDTTASGSPIHGTLTISRLVAQSESAEKMLSGFNLVPEPPPEIGYMPKSEEEVKKGIDVSSKAKQLQEFHKKSVDAPIGGVKIFPSAPPVKSQVSQVKETKPTTCIPPPFELSESKEFSKKEVVEECCIKKDIHRKEDIKVSTASPAPLSPPKTEQTDKWWSSTSDLETRSHISTDLSDYRCQSGASSQFEGRPSSPKPSADGIAMEKYWAKSKTTEANRKSWPPQAAGKETTKTFTKREEWKEPEVGYKTSTHENRDEVEEIPGGGITKTHIESTSSLETRSWSTRENQIQQTTIEKPTPPPPKPIIKPVRVPSPPPKPAPAPAPVTMYKAETTKVDHIVNSVQEKSIMEKYSSECEFNKTESMEKMSSYEELKAPGLVKAISPKPVVQLYHPAGDAPKPEPIKTFQESKSMFKGTLATAPKRPVVQLYHPSTETPREPTIILEPGPPPEMGYAPPPPMCERKMECFEKTMEMSVHSHKKEDAPPIPPKDARKTPPPLPAKKVEPFTCPRMCTAPAPSTFARGQFIESDYESDFESCKSKWRVCESENDEPKYRKVQAPTPRQPRPRSTEPGPLPPSSFEIPPPELTGPPRPCVTPDYSTEHTASTTNKKTSSMMSRHERSAKQQQHYQNQGFPQDTAVNLPKPGSPPIFVHPKTTPEPPKSKTRTFQQESGYMADTDEPFYQREANTVIQKTCGKNDGSSMSSSSYESKQFMESKTFMSSSSNQRREESSSSFSSCPTVQTPASKAQMQRSCYEKSYMSSAPTNTTRSFKNDKEETNYSWSQNQKLNSAPSPSRFARGEFRESDYESDYEGRIPPLWKPRGESDIEDHSYKSVKSNLTESPWPSTNGVSGPKEIIQPYLDILPKKAPLFITPLRDIAVVSGQTARFECIVQAEPQPNILWSKDGRIVENSVNYEVYYRNGVCRLVIPSACPSDAGTYVCTATNSLGSTATSSSLQVPGNRRSIYGTK
ncbi:titin isoform X6 [Microplitis mediator]|uniref:titin isoform X6 n=1 Tax=Microplitis mediator TaxID=375433 RepID=UPI0025564661|nr:titin isoform X6 [Microplitis mediator]